MVGDGLGDDIDGVGVIEKPSVGAYLLHILDNAFHDVNRTQRHEKAAGSLCFLSDHTVLKWNTLIKIACLKAPRAETCQHGITSLQPFAPIGSSCNGQV